MNTFSRLFVAALALTAGSAMASAATITIDSYGSKLNNGTNNTYTAANTALSFVSYNNGVTTTAASSTATYNLPAISPWANLSDPNSSWVSFNPNTYPGGSLVASNGIYTYTTTFSATSSSTGTLTVLADDTTSVYLNNVLITGAAAMIPGAVACTASSPTCTTAATYTLAGFVNGINTLSFGVVQNFNGATGVDFTGTVSTAATPEPSSLLLLATGLMGAAGAVRRRFRA